MISPILRYPRSVTPELHFDGSANSNIDLGALHDAVDKLWISMWFKLDSNFSSASSNSFWLFSKRINATNFVYVQLISSSGKLALSHQEGNGGETVLSVETSWAADTWHHVLGSLSTVAGQRLISNGGTASTGAGATAISLVKKIIIGDLTGSSGSGFIGEIRDLTIGTDDLTTTEERDLFKGIIPPIS